MSDDRSPRRVVTTTSPIEFNWPRGPEWVPKNPAGEIEPTGGDRIDLSAWRPSIPALLVPIRLETKFAKGPAGDELRIRILPDRISVQGAAPPSAGELEEAGDFWVRYHAAKSPEQRTATWRQYARRLGSTRAGFVARLTRPTLDANGQLIFPKIVPETDGAAFATLLPERWMATGWVGDKVAFQQFSASVSGPLAVSPDPTAPTTTLARSGLRIDPATAWLFDYQEALERGMAITVPLAGAAAIAADGVTTLVVIGVDEAQRPMHAAAELQALFEQHSRSAGLAFVPQGTPTNNTETVASGYRRVEAELADLEAARAGCLRPRCRRQRDEAGRRSRIVSTPSCSGGSLTVPTGSTRRRGTCASLCSRRCSARSPVTCWRCTTPTPPRSAMGSVTKRSTRCGPGS